MSSNKRRNEKKPAEEQPVDEPTEPVTDPVEQSSESEGDEPPTDEEPVAPADGHDEDPIERQPETPAEPVQDEIPAEEPTPADPVPVETSSVAATSADHPGPRCHYPDFTVCPDQKVHAFRDRSLGLCCDQFNEPCARVGVCQIKEQMKDDAARRADRRIEVAAAFLQALEDPLKKFVIQYHRSHPEFISTADVIVHALDRLRER